MRRTPLASLATVLVLTGCEPQEAVPLSRTVPIAVLQATALLVPLIGGFAWLERTAQRRSDPPPERRAIDAAGALLFGTVGVLVALPLLAFIAGTPGAYDHDTTSVFSWEDSVLLAWFFLLPVLAVSLLELRLAAACWARRPWAAWGAGLQLGALAVAVIVPAIPSN